MDRGDWWAPVHRVANSRTQLKRLSTQIRMPVSRCIHVSTNGSFVPLYGWVIAKDAASPVYFALCMIPGDLASVGCHDGILELVRLGINKSLPQIKLLPRRKAMKRHKLAEDLLTPWTSRERKLAIFCLGAPNCNPLAYAWAIPQYLE